MADIKDGGPAFPVHERHAVLRESGWRDEWLAVGGMKLRDYFAGQALAGLLANHELLTIVDSESPHPTRRAAAEYAYAVADTVLAAREAK